MVLKGENMNPATLSFDVWSVIIKQISQKDVLAVAGTCQGLLNIVNRFWLLQACSNGIDTNKIVFTAKCLTATKSIYDSQLAYSKMPWFLAAFKAWKRRDVFASMSPFYAGQRPYDSTHNDLPMYASIPRSINELFKLFSAAQKIRSSMDLPVEAWTIIIRKLPLKSLIAVARVSKDFLVIVNQCWSELAKTYGINTAGLYPRSMTILKTVYDAQQELFTSPPYLRAFETGVFGPSTSLIPFYEGQSPCDMADHDVWLYSCKPKDIRELFILFAAGQKMRFV